MWPHGQSVLMKTIAVTGQIAGFTGPGLAPSSPRSQSRKEMWLTGEKYDWLATWSRLCTAKWLTATCREYDWRRRLCISFVVCYCVCNAVHNIVSGPTAPITCSEYSFSCSCLNLCIIICKQFTNVYCNSSDHKL